MDADWGSSSDEETAAEREARDEAKRKETEKVSFLRTYFETTFQRITICRVD
jgi:hypothetical protein